MGGGASKAYKNKEIVECKIWVDTQDLTFVHPELRPGAVPGLLDKPDFGVCISGGGMRAMTLAHGWLRGLHQLGYLKQARFLSSNSGGSWLNGPLCYQHKISVDEFFGEYLPPEKCSVEALEKFQPKSHFELIGNGGFVQEAIQNLFESAITHDDRDFWSRTVGSCFFHAYGMDHDNELTRVSGSNAQSATPQSKSLKIATYDPSRGLPYPIIIGGATIGGPNVFASVEFTPLYHGIPMICDAFEMKKDLEKVELVPKKIGQIGGCYMEPIGYGFTPSNKDFKVWCKVAKDKKSNGTAVYDTNEKVIKVKFPLPDRIISVSEQAGISSSAIAQNLSKKLATLPPNAFDFPDAPYCSPVGGCSTNLRYCDGGSVDNCAFIALLRRKVTRIAAFLANNHSVCTDKYLEGVVSLSGYAGFFGRAIVQEGLETNQKQYNSARQVFASEKWDELLTGLRDNVNKGGPASHLMTLDVLPNAICGVSGNYTVKVLFTVGNESTLWQNALPHDLKNLMRESRKDDNFVEQTLKKVGLDADLSTFPYVPIDNLEYSPILMNCLSQFATWGVMANKSNLEELLK